MEITPANLEVMAGYLQQTLSPDANVRKTAEKFLESVQNNKHYSLLLLHLMDKPEVDLHIRVSAAITFKNYVKRNWQLHDGCAHKTHIEDREEIKQYIVGLMVKSPEQVQKQLSEAISIIGREDFPKRWPGLLAEMISKFQGGDFNVINGVLRTAHPIFKRYRHEFKSQELWEEIKFVLDNFAQALTELFKATMDLASKHASDPQTLKVVFSSILLICKIFYSLNFQDLPEHFEENMKVWMDHFMTLLGANNELLQTDEDETGLLEMVKSQVCDNVALYAQKYDEEFSGYLPNFVTAIWGLLANTSQAAKFDLLVSNAIQFLASVAERPAYRSLFGNTEALAGLCEKVVIPNMQLREADEELFEDNPEEYMKQDIEGSDVDTRRRGACDLVQALCKSFEGPVIENFSRYVQALLEEFGKNPRQNWKSKDAAIFLVASLASKSHTEKKGVTETSKLVDINEFYQTHIFPGIQDPNVNETPILKADLLKYLIVFRYQLPVPVLQGAVPHILRFLHADAVVVHTYAASCLEKFINVRRDGVPAIPRELMQPLAGEVLTNLFAAMEKPGSAENEYIMKAVMRTMSLLQENILPMIPQLVEGLKAKLIIVSKNPSKPHFNHYLFECLCVAIRTAGKSHAEAVSGFEEALFQPFTDILQQDVQEFIPYVFQILHLLMELRGNEIPASYQALFPHLLTPVLWERCSNIPPLVRLVQSYIRKGANDLQPDKLNGLLGVFQKLIASKSHDHEGFHLLNYIIEFVPRENLTQYISQLFVLLFQRLSSSKTTKYIKCLLVFFCLYAVKYSASSLIETIDAIQPKMFSMVVERLYLPNLQKVSGHTSRKICAVGVTKILTEADAMINGDYAPLWPRLLQTLVGLFELPEDQTLPDDEHHVEIEDTHGYEPGYSALTFAGAGNHDPLAGYAEDPKVTLAKGLQKMAVSRPGLIQPMINSGIEAQAQTFLHQYCQAANVSLS